MITDMTRSLKMVDTLRLVYWNVIFGHRMSSGGYRINTGETKRLPEPPGGLLGLMGPSGGRGEAAS